MQFIHFGCPELPCPDSQEPPARHSHRDTIKRQALDSPSSPALLITSTGLPRFDNIDQPDKNVHDPCSYLRILVVSESVVHCLKISGPKEPRVVLDWWRAFGPFGLARAGLELADLGGDALVACAAQIHLLRGALFDRRTEAATMHCLPV